MRNDRKRGGKVITFFVFQCQSTIAPIQGIKTDNHSLDAITKDKIHLLELKMCPEEQYAQFVTCILWNFLVFH